MTNTQVATLKASSAEAVSASQAGVKFRDTNKEALVLLDVTVPATGAGDTLDVYIDTSPDGGTTWVNVGHFTQVLGNGGAKKFTMALNPNNAGATAIVDVTTDAVAGATRQYGICDRLRSRSVIAGGTASFTYSVKAFLK
jgi:hypothetical protein